jgi:tetratricopeptide (TPR) repeat protein
VARFSRLTAAALAAALCLLTPGSAGALKGVAPGAKAPAFTLADPSGKVLTLSSLAGSPGAIVFWSTWSPRSEEILEDFREYHRLYAEKGLRIVAVNIDGENLDYRRRQEVLSSIDDLRLPFPVLLDENLEAFAAYGVMAHPSAVVIDGEGSVTYTLGGYPLSLREELRDNLLKVLGLYVEPARPEPLADIPIARSIALRHYNLGRRLMAKGQMQRALKAFDRAAAEDPSYFEPAIMAARLDLSAENPARAETLLKSAGPEAVNRNDLRFLLGSLLLYKGKTDAAEKTFNTLREKSPGEGWGSWGLGLVGLSRGETGEALEWMKRAYALQPQNAEAEAWLRRHLTGIWLRGESAPLEDDLVALFPSLAELRDRYRRMFNAGTPAP